MTHRVHPYIFRIDHTVTWRSRWFSVKAYREHLREDTLLRIWLKKKLASAHIAAIEIERSPNTVHIVLRTSRPGILIGRGGEGMTKLKKDIEAFLITIWKWRRAAREKLGKREVKITVEEVKSPEANAAVVAHMITEDIERRLPFRRVLKQTLDKIMARKEVLGAKISLSGRLDGSEMARYEWAKRGRIPLQTMRADVDYEQKDAFTTYGVIGVKVWIYKGDIFENSKSKNQNSK